MPFDDDSEDFISNKKVGLKLSNKPSSEPFVPSKEDFDKKVNEVQQKSNSYKERAAELAIAFKKIMQDKTLPQNKAGFALDVEKEVLTKMVNLAIEINNDENEQEGMGSLGWITLSLKYLIMLKDRINVLEYKNLELQKDHGLLKTELQLLKNKLGIDNDGGSK